MSPSAFFLSLPAPLAIAVIGRVLLSLLPAGRPGRHAFDEFGATFGVSFALGLLYCGVLTQLGELVGARIGGGTLVTPIVLLAILRRLSLPATASPPDDPREDAGGYLRFATSFATLGALAHLFVAFHVGEHAGTVRLTQWQGALPTAESFEYAFWIFGGGERPGHALAGWCAVASVAIVAFALRTARRNVLGRGLVAFLLAFAPVAPAWTALATGPRTAIPGALLLVAGAGCGLAWMRRADARGAWLALLFLGGAPLFDPTLACFSLPALWLFGLATPEGARRRTLLFAALAALPGAYLAWSVEALAPSDPLAPFRELVRLAGPWGLWMPLLLIAFVRVAIGFAMDSPQGHRGPRVGLPLRELSFVGFLLVFAPILAGWVTSWDDLRTPLAVAGPRAVLSVLVPWAALCCGLALVPGDREPRGFDAVEVEDEVDHGRREKERDAKPEGAAR